jgi:hypothetical protein
MQRKTDLIILKISKTPVENRAQDLLWRSASANCDASSPYDVRVRYLIKLRDNSAFKESFFFKLFLGASAM